MIANDIYQSGSPVDFTYTRAENDQTLLSRIDAIRQGQDLDVLEPFAKAYLGLFYDIDNHIPPAERIDLLANKELSQAIQQGLLNVLQREDLPTVEEITRANQKLDNRSIGFAILAGMSLCANKSMHDLYNLPSRTLSAAICFHHLFNTFHEDSWYQSLLTENPQQSAQALLTMWQVLIDNKQDFLPGLKPVIDETENIPLFRLIVVPLLQAWPYCRHRDLFGLLGRAIRYADRASLLDASIDMLEKGELLNLRNQVYWQTTAFLLAPEQHGQRLINFMGQEKMKLLPMLDFVMSLLDSQENEAFQLSANGYGFLIRCLAQKFTPQMDVYNNLGEITVKVLWLFYKLACFSSEDGRAALKTLRKVRVLKIYSDIFDSIAEYQDKPDKPDFQFFVQSLRDEGRLKMKKNWHDVK